jgi:hypothetical protein
MLNNITKLRFGQNYNGKNTVIGFRSSGYWSDDIHFINDKDSLQLQKALKLITKSELTKIDSKDVVYAAKASDIPRFKLKEFIKENKLRKTSRAGMASVFIINKGYFYDLVKRLKYGEHYFMNGDIALNNYTTVLGTTMKKDGTSLIDMFKHCNDQNTFMYVETRPNDLKDTFTKNPGAESAFNNSVHLTKGTIFDVYREAKLIDLLSLICNNVDNILNGKIRIIFDEELFVTLNKEGIELDDEYLQTLRDMLFSKDDANVKLGFEMMSNLVVNNHMLLSTSFLLNELVHTTGFRPSYYTNNNTNLKALLKVLKTKGIAWERDWKTFGTGLRNNFKTGVEGDVVKKFLLDNINREFKISNSAAEALVDIVFTTEVK